MAVKALLGLGMSGKISAAITLAALLIAVGHQIFPSILLDTPTLVLLGVAAVPWLGNLLKSVELPGGVKIEFQDVKRTEVQAAKAGLLASPPKKDQSAYELVLQQDPNLALAGLRIEIEKRLRAIADRHELPSEGVSTGSLLRQLRDRKVLTPQQDAVLRDLVVLLNGAVHGAQVAQKTAASAIDVGSQILAGLDEIA